MRFTSGRQLEAPDEGPTPREGTVGTHRLRSRSRLVGVHDFSFHRLRSRSRLVGVHDFSFRTPAARPWPTAFFAGTHPIRLLDHGMMPVGTVSGHPATTVICLPIRVPRISTRTASRTAAISARSSSSGGIARLMGARLISTATKSSTASTSASCSRPGARARDRLVCF